MRCAHNLIEAMCEGDGWLADVPDVVREACVEALKAFGEGCDWALARIRAAERRAKCAGGAQAAIEEA